MAAEISIVTAAHNALAVNRFYWKTLSENTGTPFELILVDNHSTDGSEIFFRELSAHDPRVKYVRNETNQSYPASQRQGMRYATTDFFFFLNNDVWLPKGWERPLLRTLRENPLQVVSPSGQEAQPTQAGSTRLKNRWRWVTRLSLLWQKLFGTSEEERLWWATKQMYGSLDRFESPTPQQGSFDGIKGDTVAFHRRLLEIVPDVWHERIEAADWHLYLSLARLHEQRPEIPLPQVLCDSYVHHFGRYSARLKFEPLPLKEPFLSIEAYWGAATVKRLWWGHHLPAR